MLGNTLTHFSARAIVSRYLSLISVKATPLKLCIQEPIAINSPPASLEDHIGSCILRDALITYSPSILISAYKAEPTSFLQSSAWASDRIIKAYKSRCCSHNPHHAL